MLLQGEARRGNMAGRPAPQEFYNNCPAAAHHAGSGHYLQSVIDRPTNLMDHADVPLPRSSRTNESLETNGSTLNTPCERGRSCPEADAVAVTLMYVLEAFTHNCSL